MTVQVLTNDNPKLAEQIARDLAGTIWRLREALLQSTKLHSITKGVALAKQATADRNTPVVLADHSDRSGSATWLLREIIAQDLANTVIATIADGKATASLKAAGAKAGDNFDMEIGGLADESAGDPVRIQGTISAAAEGYGQFWVCVRFGRNNVLILSTYLVQIMEPFSLKALVPDIGAFDVMAIKSRVHFRRGFDDNGFAKTILLVEPEQPFLGTTRLDKLPYRNVDLTRYYPYGNPAFPERRHDRRPLPPDRFDRVALCDQAARTDALPADPARLGDHDQGAARGHRASETDADPGAAISRRQLSRRDHDARL